MSDPPPVNFLLPKHDGSSILNGRHLIVAAETWKPWFEIAERSDGSLAYNGIMLNVLLYLSESLNFTYTMV